MMKKHAVKEVDELKQAFDVFDKDGDGSISAKELEIVMKGQTTRMTRDGVDNGRPMHADGLAPSHHGLIVRSSLFALCQLWASPSIARRSIS